METPRIPSRELVGLTLYSLEKLIEWKHNEVARGNRDFDTLYSLEKLIEWKLENFNSFSEKLFLGLSTR